MHTSERETLADVRIPTVQVPPHPVRIERTPAETEALRDVVARHLVRFAFRETLTFDWRSTPGAA